MADLLETVDKSVTVVLDLDNTLVAYGAQPDDLQHAYDKASRLFAGKPTLQGLLVVTNGRSRGLSGVVSGALKPWTRRSKLGLSDHRGCIWVVGDQWLTDGLLAWRIGARYVHCPITESHEPWWPRLQRRLSAMVAWLFEESDVG